MTDREKIDLKVYLDEKFEALDIRLNGFDARHTKSEARINALEKDLDERVGRNNFAKAIGAALSAAAATVAVYLGLKDG